jgi:hypothetical protein
VGDTNGHLVQPRPVETRHKRRKALGTRRCDLPLYAYPMDINLTSIAKALCKAPTLAEARAVAADGARTARAIFGRWEVVAEVDPARMPAIESSLRLMASRVVPWADQLRLVGNGVDVLVAAYAFLSLWACIGD